MNKRQRKKQTKKDAKDFGCGGRSDNYQYFSEWVCGYSVIFSCDECAFSPYNKGVGKNPIRRRK